MFLTYAKFSLVTLWKLGLWIVLCNQTFWLESKKPEGGLVALLGKSSDPMPQIFGVVAALVFSTLLRMESIGGMFLLSSLKLISG